MLRRVDWYSHRRFVEASCYVGPALFRNMHVLRCVHLPISVQHNPTFNTPVTMTQELLHSISLHSLNPVPPFPSSLSKWTFHKRFPHKNSPYILFSPTKVNAQISLYWQYWVTCSNDRWAAAVHRCSKTGKNTNLYTWDLRFPRRSVWRLLSSDIRRRGYARNVPKFQKYVNLKDTSSSVTSVPFSSPRRPLFGQSEFQQKTVYLISRHTSVREEFIY
jgi:hypothetical protein